jgi:peptidyl-tRNA hydrolase ICT1
LHLNLKTAAQFLPEFVLQKVRENAHQYLTKDDEIVLQADENRKQSENMQAVYHRLHQILVSSVSKDVPGVTSAEQKKRVAQLYSTPVQVLMEGTTNSPQGKRRMPRCEES